MGYIHIASTSGSGMRTMMSPSPVSFSLDFTFRGFPETQTNRQRTKATRLKPGLTRLSTHPKGKSENCEFISNLNYHPTGSFQS